MCLAGFIACVADGISEQATGFPRGLAARKFSSGEAASDSNQFFATRVHGFATKTKALAREIPPATQATGLEAVGEVCSKLFPIHCSQPPILLQKNNRLNPERDCLLLNKLELLPLVHSPTFTVQPFM